MTATQQDTTGRFPAATRRPLSDGREIRYFDDHPGVLHDAVDSRNLEPAAHAGTVRHDVLTGEWVTIAAHRMTRTFLPSRADCPLCPTLDRAHPTEVPESSYDVAVFDNRFPSFSTPAEEPVTAASRLDVTAASRLDVTAASRPAVTAAARLGAPDAPATGRCEVICFSSDHSASVSELSPRRMRTVVGAWAQRTAELSAEPAVAQVFCFENRGEEIGVTLTHPHGQIYAYPFVAPRTQALLNQAKAHVRRTGGNLLRDVLHHEQRAAVRMVLAGEHWSAYVPTAARWPIEVHLAPHRDVPDLAALSQDEADELADVYQELLRRVDRFFPGVEKVPYIAGWHQAPTGEARELGRLHLQVFSVLRAPGKLKFLAGSESGAGAWVNDASPEAIAQRLREVAS
ncbi:MAG: galactose-1-phosphate uridylyltransferase [Mycobacteriaceae bacterium]